MVQSPYLWLLEQPNDQPRDLGARAEEPYDAYSRLLQERMDTIKNAGNYISDKLQSVTSDSSKEANKEAAKDNNDGVGNR